VLAHALRSTFVTGQLLRNNVGIAYPAIDESCLPDVVLPFTAEQIAALEDAATQLLIAETVVDSLREAFRNEVAATV
jgi:hypothetical protein